MGRNAGRTQVGFLISSGAPTAYGMEWTRDLTKVKIELGVRELENPT